MKPHPLSSILAGALLALALPLGAQAQTLTVGFADPLSSLDPQLNNHAGDRSLALHFFDAIVDRRDGKTLPSLAKSWRTIDPTTWEFKLNPDIKWHDGQPFTAEDLIFSFERARKVPGSVASYASSLRNVVAVESPDPHTLIVRTRIPDPNLLLSIGAVHVVSRHVGANASTADYNTGKALVGTGPYKYVAYTPGDRVVFERNPDYWGDTPQWERVTFRYINNGAARTAALLAGDVDVIDKVPVADLKRLSDDPKLSVHAYRGLRVLLIQPSFRPGPNEFIRDNAGQPLPENPLTDVRVRRALSLAINRPAIVDRVLHGGVTEANQWMPADTFGYNPDIKNIPYDAGQARKLLAEAGFPEGFQITIHVPGDRYPQAPEALQAVAQFWSRIGVKTQIESVPWAVYSSRANKNEFAVSVIAWGNGTGEAAYGLTNVLATHDRDKGLGISNWGRYSNPKVDQALERATAEFDAPKREAILRESATIVTDDVGVIPLFHYRIIWASKKGLKVEPYISDRTTAITTTRIRNTTP